ncbi:MAG: SDR family NAD(P)-dependent oxidoreductase [Desulfobacterales bacterium]
MALNLDAVGKPIGPITRDYTWKDVVLYALGVGAGFDDLDYCYEKGLKVLPSFSAAAIFEMFFLFGAEANVNPAGILHGEQRLVFHQAIPTSGTLTTTGRIVNCYDKGRETGALVVGESETWHSNGHKIFDATFVLFSRLDGGFGGPDAPPRDFSVPDRPPDMEFADTPGPNQPLLYRLSGDTFQLHVDGSFAKAAGFEKPIIHGLCTHGYACRALVSGLTPGDPQRIRRMDCRFTKPLYPGVSIKTQIWKTGQGAARWRVINSETADAVIDQGFVEYDAPVEAIRIRFDDRVAVVTGAGGGLGRAYALELARRGAKVVVNDLGGPMDGAGRGSSAPAEQVVREIRELGGEAVASFDTVATPEGGRGIIQTALDAFGTVDIVINNAGILRDKSFAKLTPDHWYPVIDVHLNGAYNVTRPAFEVMKGKGYGRILMTGSAAGLYGHFGQSNYSAAKMGLVGLMNTLKLEGERYGVRVNTLIPLAASRLTEGVLPTDLYDQARPEFVVPMTLFLCSDACNDTGLVFTAGMGHFSRAAVLTGPGTMLGDGKTPPTIEAVAAAMDRISTLEGAKEFRQASEQLIEIAGVRARIPSKGKPASALAGPEPSVAGVFQSLPEAFNADAGAGVEAIFQFRISGADGGDWHCIIQDDICRVHRGVHDGPTSTLLMRDDDFLALVDGRLDPIDAFTSGKLIVSGDLAKSQLIGSLFNWGNSRPKEM